MTALGTVDTVETASGFHVEQPFAELGLTDDEYARIWEVLGRRPTQTELAMYAVMWSEHCSYKSSRVHLRQFAEKTPPGSAEVLLVGMGENAGVVDVGGGLAVTFKIESHNHPSFVEPYQGAATGVGGIVRDILTMGARPVAVMNSLRFGAADHPDTRRVLPGVVAGIGGYGNCLGLPTIGGEVVFDPCYQGNPLVNALCVGVLPADRIQRSAARGPGNVVVLLGAKTGRDGIGGVSVLASASFDAHGGAVRRPSVQVGDPFAEKLLIECCLELYARGLVTGIQDLGGAGLTCATTETAAAGDGGMRVYLERVPLREPSMLPHEILASESQERMLAIVEPGHLDEVLALARTWEVPATAIGEVTDGDRLVISWHGEVVADVPPGSLADDGPVYRRPMHPPNDFELVRADRAETLPRPRTGDALRATLLRLVASPNLADKTWVVEQYDRYVGGDTVLAQPEDAGVLRLAADGPHGAPAGGTAGADGGSGGPDGGGTAAHGPGAQTGPAARGIALSVDGNGRYARLDPYAGAQLALAEAYRNVAVTGARPLAVTNCLNFGSPEDAAVMWQFAQAVTGLADACQALGVPVTGGNVSFYNQTGSAPIHPTPVVGVLGVLADVTRRTPMGLRREGETLLLLGDTREELSGSEWAWVEHRHLGGVPPAVDLDRERQLATVLVAAAADGLVSAAHDLSDGGLAVALVEACLRHGVGARVAPPPAFAGDGGPFVWLFSESAGRAVVAVPADGEGRFAALCASVGVPCTRIGVSGGPALEVDGLFSVGLDELRAAHTATLPALFD